MSQEFAQYNQHFVCTEAEARELIEQAKHVMVAHCGCRKSDGCSRSQSEVCLWFVDSGGFESRPITKDEVLVILAYGKEMGLVFRPFRSSTNKNSTEGICLCCVIDQDLCYGCGLCVSACPSNCITMSLGDAL
ncbi:MAG: 4Fe-4S binding protein [Peptococcaceae bacterium]|nr:4Fe-4S binding protein [Peptococcaceae bacterium]